MLARIVANWLTSAGELGYQAAFAQLLSAEGFRVLHAPVHHPFEHGKDLIAYSSDGALWAFQLKGGDIDLGELGRIQGQLFALAGTAVEYPGVEPPRPPDRVALVTNGKLTTPARDRLRSFNEASRSRGFPTVEIIEGEQLVGRFVEAHGDYLPTALEDLNRILKLVLERGDGPFPVLTFSNTLADLIRSDDEASDLALGRAIASSTLLSAYVAGPWQRAGNHLGVAEAWLSLAIRILYAAGRRDLADEHWRLSFELARDSARSSLMRLLDEATEADDLVMPDLVEGLVYPTRATLLCGYCSAFLLSEDELGNSTVVSSKVKQLLDRELVHAKAPGEAAAPHLLLSATAYEVLGNPEAAMRVMYQWATALANLNHPDQERGVPSPYHSLGDALLSSVGADTPIDEETFAGEAYTLHVAVEWLSRRGFRPLVESIWPAATYVHFVEYRPNDAAGILLHYDDRGQQHTWVPQSPQSWKALSDSAKLMSESDLPALLWQHLYMLPYLVLLFPYRLTSITAKALDYMSVSLCDVLLSDDTPTVT